MDVLYSAGKATAAAVHQALPDPPSYSAVRATLRILEEKGHVRPNALRFDICSTPSSTDPSLR
jgi:predicted transcriptional regulator